MIINIEMFRKKDCVLFSQKSTIIDWIINKLILFGHTDLTKTQQKKSYFDYLNNVKAVASRVSYRN